MNFAVLAIVPVSAARNYPTNLASVHALVGDEGLGVVPVLVRVTEADPGERSAYSRIH
jgi:hypothetical protein